MNNTVKIIAECGVNHNGDISLAKEMIDVAVESGADFVKFQTYKTENLVKKQCPMAEYQVTNLQENKSQYEMLKQYELSESNFLELFEYSQKKGIKFLSTPFDIESLLLLIRLGLKTIKISSGDLTNAPLLLEAAKSELEIILSTGMACLEEIDAAMAVLYWGYHNGQNEPESFQEILKFPPFEFSKLLYRKVSLLHCLSDYPARVEYVNLKAIKTLSDRYQLRTGYSDHTLGYHITCAAVALGAGVIEKHFTLNRNLPGPDHKASLIPSELTTMVKSIRDIENAMGDGIKKPQGNEIATALLVRKGLYVKNNIAKDQIITANDVACLRPVTSHSPTLFWDCINKKAEKDYSVGDPL